MKVASEQIQNKLLKEILSLKEELTEVESDLFDIIADLRKLVVDLRKAVPEEERNVGALVVVLDQRVASGRAEKVEAAEMVEENCELRTTTCTRTATTRGVKR